MKKIYRIVVSALLLTVPVCAQQLGTSQSTTIQNEALKVDISHKSGCFSVKDKATGYVWKADPWEQSAATLSLRTSSGKRVFVDLSTAETINVAATGTGNIAILFRNPLSPDGRRLKGIEVETALAFTDEDSELTAKVVRVTAPKEYKVDKLEYPLRSFYLTTEVERGLVAIPYIQGVVVPSYAYPARNSKLYVDDFMWTSKSMGEMKLHEFGARGISMPWFGVEGETSAAMTIIPDNGSVSMKYIINNNDRDNYIKKHNRESSYPRILSVYPVWDLKNFTGVDVVTFHFIPNGDYVAMAKHYRELAIEKGNFVSLREKAKKAPGVNKMPGEIYIALYGGYPHYVNFPGQEFTFDEVKEILTDLHDTLNVERLWITLWGAWENYPPQHWPPNEKAGGVEGLKAVVDLAKSYDYLIGTYYAWGALLEHDPNYDYNLLEKAEDGSYIFGNRWSQVDPKRFSTKAKEIIGLANREVGFNAIYNDSQHKGNLGEFLGSLGLPVSNQRVGNTELHVKHLHQAEGLAPHNGRQFWSPHVEAPLFNLVYHDALMTTSRWQSPDNDYDLNGDYAVRCLRNMLYGNGVMYVVPPYEYPGIRTMIRQAVKLMAPLHKETAFEELTRHEYLSVDMMVQRSEFANGTVVTVNMGLVEQKLPDGTMLPGCGFRIEHQDQSTTEGAFKYEMNISKTSITKEDD